MDVTKGFELSGRDSILARGVAASYPVSSGPISPSSSSCGCPLFLLIPFATLSLVRCAWLACCCVDEFPGLVMQALDPALFVCVGRLFRCHLQGNDLRKDIGIKQLPYPVVEIRP